MAWSTIIRPGDGSPESPLQVALILVSIIQRGRAWLKNRTLRNRYFRTHPDIAVVTGFG